MKQFFMYLLLGTTLAAKAQPPNNPVFAGGGGGGWNRTAFQQSAATIFTGGGGDGWGTASVAQPVVNIFSGGSGDGWNYQNFVQTSTNIFAGGSGDGWSYEAFLQAGNGIFNGGIGDGWNYETFLQAGNAIFSGGGGDGWSSTYRPLGVLPVTMVTFTAEKQQSTATLKWQTSAEINTAAFEIERSNDATRFTNIGRVAAAGTSSTLRDYQFTDAQPMTGTNYYRLRQVDNNGAAVYTPTRLVVFDASMLQKLKVYPVPATALLTVELPQEFLNEDIVLNVSNALGVMVQHRKIKRNTGNRQTLNISLLPPGVYTLQVSGSSYNGLQMIIKQ